MTELQTLQHQHELEKQAQAEVQHQEQQQLFQKQRSQLQEREAAFFKLQAEFQQDPTPLREHELLMLQQAGQHAQELFTQQQQHLLESHRQEQLRLEERHWHQQQLLHQQLQQQLHQNHQNHQNQQNQISQYQQPQRSEQPQQHQHHQHHPVPHQQQHQRYVALYHQPQQPAQPQQQLLSQQADDNDVEAMDVDDENVLLSIASTITNLREQPASVSTGTISTWESGPATFSSSDTVPDGVVVFDTNVLISHLNFIQTLIEAHGSQPTSKQSGKLYVLFVIPWIVVQELDGLKGDGGRHGGNELDLTGKARRAIRYLENELDRPTEYRRLRGQRISERIEKEEKNDDKILDCCRYFGKLYSDQKSTKLTLFSNDRNLCVKAAIHNIQTASREKTILEIEAFTATILGRNSDISPIQDDDNMMIDDYRNTSDKPKASSPPRKILSGSSKVAIVSSKMGKYRTEVNERELQRIKATSKVTTAPEGMDPMLFALASHIVKNLRRCLEVAVLDHLQAFYGDDWKSLSDYNATCVKESDMVYDCRRLLQPLQLLQRHWKEVYASLYGSIATANRARTHLDGLQSFVKQWDRVEMFGLGKVYKKDLTAFLDDVNAVLDGVMTRPEKKVPSHDGRDDLFYDAQSRLRLMEDWRRHSRNLQN